MRSKPSEGLKSGKNETFMADIQILGHIANIKYQKECILIFVDERRRGFKRNNGTVVGDTVLTWKCIFSGSDSKRSYIDRYFNTGMLVKVKGEALPYAIEQDNMVDGYSVLIQSINVAPYPSDSIRREIKMQKESQLHSSGEPDLEGYNQPDF